MFDGGSWPGNEQEWPLNSIALANVGRYLGCLVLPRSVLRPSCWNAHPTIGVDTDDKANGIQTNVAFATTTSSTRLNIRLRRIYLCQ